jgi:hypothetical protein
MKPSTQIKLIDDALLAINKVQASGNIGIDLDFNIDQVRRDLIRNRSLCEDRLGTGSSFFRNLIATLN